MLQRVSVMFLAVAVCVTNAYCACIAPDFQHPSHHEAQAAKPAHPGCNGHRQKSNQQPDHEQHSCGHCAGTVFASASCGKTTSPAPLLSPLYCLDIVQADVTADAATSGQAFDHCGLSPPVPLRTLLNLSCSFTN